MRCPDSLLRVVAHDIAPQLAVCLLDDVHGGAARFATGSWLLDKRQLCLVLLDLLLRARLTNKVRERQVGRLAASEFHSQWLWKGHHLCRSRRVEGEHALSRAAMLSDSALLLPHSPKGCKRGQEVGACSRSKIATNRSFASIDAVANHEIRVLGAQQEEVVPCALRGGRRRETLACASWLPCSPLVRQAVSPEVGKWAPHRRDVDPGDSAWYPYGVNQPGGTNATLTHRAGACGSCLVRARGPTPHFHHAQGTPRRELDLPAILRGPAGLVPRARDARLAPTAAGLAIITPHPSLPNQRRSDPHRHLEQLPGGEKPDTVAEEPLCHGQGSSSAPPPAAQGGGRWCRSRRSSARAGIRGVRARAFRPHPGAPQQAVDEVL